MNSDGKDGNWKQGSVRGGRRRSVVARRRPGTRSVQRRAATAKRTYTRSREPSAKRDYLTRRGAETLARHIENYWRSLGYNVRTWLMPIKASDVATTPEEVMDWRRRSSLWCVRSSLANGLPPGRANPFHGGDSLANRRFQRAGVKYIDASVEGRLSEPGAVVEAANSGDPSAPDFGKVRDMASRKDRPMQLMRQDPIARDHPGSPVHTGSYRREAWSSEK